MTALAGIALLDVLNETFTESLDGYFYPDEAGSPLVRVSVAKSGYCVERRRNVDSPWMPVVTASIGEFDAVAWRSWRSSFRMSA